MKIKKISLIFSGYNQRAVIAFIRTLEKNNLEYAIIANSEDDNIFSTTYARNVLAIRGCRDLVLNDILTSITKAKKNIEADKFIIVPSSEALNRFLLKHKRELMDIDCEVPLVNEKLYENISDKYKFNKLCIKNNITVPMEYKCISENIIPFVAKPKNYFSSDGKAINPVLITDKNEYKSFTSNYKIDDFYYQQFIGGKSFYLLYYFSKNGSILKFSQENYVQQPNGKSIIACISSDFHETEFSSEYEKMFVSLNFFGLIMIEVKENDGKTFMIEANPRLWGPSQLFVDAGVNFFELFLYDNGILKNNPIFEKPKKKFKYFWLGGLLQSIREKDRDIAYYNYSLKKLINELPTWLESEIYCRKDSYKIFKQENKL